MNNKSREVVILSASRTPIGTYKGALKNTKAHQLGSIVIKDVLKKTNLEPDQIDEVIIGQVLTSAGGQNPARQAAINAGISVSKPAHLINQVCGSGLRSIISGYQSILLGDSNTIIAGGQECMSLAPHSIFYRDKKKLDEKSLVDTMLHDGLMDAFNNYHMGVTAENISKKFNIDREAQDVFAFNSQLKAKKAINEKKFEEEIVKIKKDDNNYLLEIDEHPRPNLLLSDLSNLKPVFDKNGSVTAGNSSGINDGAAAIIMSTLEFAKKNSIEPIAKIISWASTGIDPAYMGLGPIESIKHAIKKAKWNLRDIDLFEINEAFAAQV